MSTRKVRLSEVQKEWLRNAVLPPLAGSRKMMDLAKRFHEKFGGRRIGAAVLHKIATKIQADAKKAAAEKAKKVAKKVSAKKSGGRKARKTKGKKHDFTPDQEAFLRQEKPEVRGSGKKTKTLPERFEDEFGVKLTSASIYSKRVDLRRKDAEAKKITGRLAKPDTPTTPPPAPTPPASSVAPVLPVAPAPVIMMEIAGVEIYRGPGDVEVEHAILVDGEVRWTGPVAPESIDVFVKKTK